MRDLLKLCAQLQLLHSISTFACMIIGKLLLVLWPLETIKRNELNRKTQPIHFTTESNACAYCVSAAFVYPSIELLCKLRFREHKKLRSLKEYCYTNCVDAFGFVFIATEVNCVCSVKCDHLMAIHWNGKWLLFYSPLFSNSIKFVLRVLSPIYAHQNDLIAFLNWIHSTKR